MEVENNIQTAPATNPRARLTRWVIKHDVSCVSLISLSFLIINSIAAICRSIHDPTTLAFVVFSNVDIILLYLCLSQYPSASAKRKEVLKAAVWILATLLTAVFCYRVAGLMPLVMAGIVWGMGAVSISGSFYALFVYKDAGQAAAQGKTGLKQPC